VNTARQVAREATPGGVEGALDSLSKPGNRERFNQLIQETSQSAGQGFARGMTAAITTRMATTAQAGAATTQPLAGDRSFEQAAGETSRRISREAVLGVRDALRELDLIGPDNTLNSRLLAKEGGVLAWTLSVATV